MFGTSTENGKGNFDKEEFEGQTFQQDLFLQAKFNSFKLEQARFKLDRGEEWFLQCGW